MFTATPMLTCAKDAVVGMLTSEAVSTKTCKKRLTFIATPFAVCPSFPWLPSAGFED